MDPLAHDAHGNTVLVPQAATQWRVRRQTGGRPGFVYGNDGAPLTGPLDAMAEDLRAAGCGPGAYRLDAVDEKGKPVGATAFTQLEADLSAVPESAARATAGGDALVGRWTGWCG